MPDSRECSEVGCTEKHSARGLCNKHYQRLIRPPKSPKEIRLCSQPDCTKKHWSKGLCNKHYQRLRKKTGLAQPREFRPCSDPGCERRRTARGLCDMHYQRLRYERKPRVIRTGCSEVDCNGNHYGHGLCQKHYSRKRYQELGSKGRSSSAVVGSMTDVVIKSGFDWDLEKEADRLLKEAFGGDQPDWFTEGQLEATRKYREAYTSMGFPDENIMEGRVFRAYNPLFGKRRPELVDY